MEHLKPEQISEIYQIKCTSKVEEYTKLFIEYLPKYGIVTEEQIRVFIAQIGHESGRLVYTEEIASGSSYEGRKDLGNTQLGDGKRYKGRGLIQITGRDNYKKLSEALGVDFINNPEKLRERKYAVISACWFWKKNKINDLIDGTEEGVRRSTKKINGRYNGLEDRLTLYRKAKEAFAHK